MSSQIKKASRKRNLVFIMLSAGLVIFFISAVTNFIIKRKLEDNTALVNHTYQVVLESEKLLSLLKDAETGQRGFILTGKPEYLEPYNKAKESINVTFAEVKTMTSDNAKQQKNLEKLKVLIDAQLSNVNESIRLKENEGDSVALAFLQEGTGKKIMDAIRLETKQIQQIEQDLLTTRTKEMASSSDAATLVQFLIFLVSGFVLVYSMVTIMKQVKIRKQMFERLNKYNREYLLDNGTQEGEEQAEEEIINNLIDNLKDTTGFVQQIGKGNYEIQLAGITENNLNLNENNLAGALLEMKKQLQQIAKEEKQRGWTNEGLAMFAEILRHHNDNLSLLADKVVSELVKYIKANQAALFVVNDSNPANIYLELASCYAYNRKKYLQKEIAIGEGLVGQAYQEKDSIYLTDIPASYIKITSGLGAATPRCVLIVPLKVNEVTYGILEIASFQPLENYVIDFIKKVSESIASTLSMVKVNEQTKLLLEESQMLAEQLRAQEEEMRQNMEELQATQEEMERSQKRKAAGSYDE